MNRYQSYGRSHRDRYQGDTSRQHEQFASSDDDYGDDDVNYRQMGEGGSRGEYGQFDNDGYGSGSRGGGWAGDRDRRGYGREGGNRERGLYSEQSEGYSSGGYGPSRYTNNESRGFSSFTSNDYGGRDFAGPRQHFGPGSSSSDAYGVYGGSSYGAGTYGGYGRSSYGADRYGSRSGGGNYSSSSRRRDWDDRGYQRDHERGFFERAGDEVASWFGDEEAARRREQDHRGRGPANYTRSDERILEDACDRLTEDWGVDASNIQVTVQNGEVTLDGTVASRQQKRRAEDCVDDLSGVKHVQNNLRVQQSSSWGRDSTGQNTSSQSSSQSVAGSSYDGTDSTPGTLP